MHRPRIKDASLLFSLAGIVAAGSAAWAQAGARSMGTVATANAVVTNAGQTAVEVSGGRVALVGNSTVTAKDRTAEVSLTRGGMVRVCQTSGLHMTGSDAGTTEGSLLLALDRGALEIRMNASTHDIVMTPDLRFTMAANGPLDLRMRVTTNGDTCVENRGGKAPTLRITDVFGEGSYEVMPGQHLLFEHGNLREVVDRETTPCGCPPDEPQAVSIAEAALHGGSSSVNAKQAEAANPFPAAVSEGLAPPKPLPPEAPGGTHVQVGATLAYDPAKAVTPNAAAAQDKPAAESNPGGEAQPASARGRGPLRAIGRFFKRIFVR